MFINTDGGFYSKALIHFIFQGVGAEESDEPIQVGQWFIYDELQKTEDGFAFRVLFDCPEAEWTIAMKELDAQYYYRPNVYVRLRDEEKLEETSLTEYIAQLNPNHRYWLITPDVTCPIESLTEELVLENGSLAFGQHEMVVTIGDKRFTYSVDNHNPIAFIYTDVYEDPYADLNEPVPTEQLEEAALSDELELQVRAWNTMYAVPEDVADIINRVLLQIEVTEENEMMFYVYVNHFYKAGILVDAVVVKHKALIE